MTWYSVKGVLMGSVGLRQSKISDKAFGMGLGLFLAHDTASGVARAHKLEPEHASHRMSTLDRNPG